MAGPATHRWGYYKILVHWKNRPNSESILMQATELTHLYPELFDFYVRQNCRSQILWGSQQIKKLSLKFGAPLKDIG